MQELYGTSERARRFYRDQVLDHLNPRMREFIARQEMVFVATSDSRGECDSSLRAGPPGFVHVIDRRTLAYPEYRGNGVLASVGNIRENPHIGLMFLDFERDHIGLHVNGRAAILDDVELRRHSPDLPEPAVPGQRAQMWVVARVEEAYIHCRKHIPRMRRVDAQEPANWGSDDMRRKGGDFFDAKGTPSPWSGDPLRTRG
ncbi:pyridoxamine 5'-phosphate oxidase family protein [Marinactinospora thermotolerans]|nr:pyridoxamine 5'-phosphate oxidase family protein [Marinactinospora thermotolerans]